MAAGDDDVEREREEEQARLVRLRELGESERAKERERTSEGWSEGARERGSEGWRERGMEEARERGSEGEREGEKSSKASLPY